MEGGFAIIMTFVCLRVPGLRCWMSQGSCSGNLLCCRVLEEEVIKSGSGEPQEHPPSKDRTGGGAVRYGTGAKHVCDNFNGRVSQSVIWRSREKTAVCSGCKA